MNRTIPRLIRVFYEPPPFGPRTSLDRSTYGMEGGTTPAWVEKLSKMPAWQPIVAGCTLMLVGGYVPIVLLEKDLPFTLSPEYQAATRKCACLLAMKEVYILQYLAIVAPRYSSLRMNGSSGDVMDVFSTISMLYYKDTGIPI